MRLNICVSILAAFIIIGVTATCTNAQTTNTNNTPSPNNGPYDIIEVSINQYIPVKGFIPTHQNAMGFSDLLTERCGKSKHLFDCLGIGLEAAPYPGNLSSGSDYIRLLDDVRWYFRYNKTISPFISLNFAACYNFQGIGLQNNFWVWGATVGEKIAVSNNIDVQLSLGIRENFYANISIEEWNSRTYSFCIPFIVGMEF